MRETTGFPGKMGNFTLSTEELATMIHPPIALESLGSFLPRVSVAKREASPGIPIDSAGVPKNEKQDSMMAETKKGEAPPEIPAK